MSDSESIIRSLRYANRTKFLLQICCKIYSYAFVQKQFRRWSGCANWAVNLRTVSFWLDEGQEVKWLKWERERTEQPSTSLLSPYHLFQQQNPPTAVITGYNVQHLYMETDQEILKLQRPLSNNLLPPSTMQNQ